MTFPMTQPRNNQDAPPVSGDVALRLSRAADALGFDAFGITSADALRHSPYDPARQLDRFLALGRHGDMTWMAEHADRRSDPKELWGEARSLIMLGSSYAPDENPLAILTEPERAALSVYARGKDYHDILKGRLKQLASIVAAETGGDVKVFVDTAPLMEKPLAAAAGLGWQGKHTNLVSTEHGSWLFLGAILTSAALPAAEPHADRCGSCRRCLDVCPTDAFPSPYELDARRCIAYLTIEHKGHIPREFRKPIGNRVFGCDDCLAVCPWNKFARRSRELRYQARAETDNPPLGELLALDDTAFRTRFAGTPIKRTGRDRFMRNVLIATGNTREVRYVPAVCAHLDDASPLVRAMVVWALGEIADPHQLAEWAAARAGNETDKDVLAEWRHAMTGGRRGGSEQQA